MSVRRCRSNGSSKTLTAFAATLFVVVNKPRKMAFRLHAILALGGEPKPAWDAVSSSAPVSIRAPSNRLSSLSVLDFFMDRVEHAVDE